MSNPKTFEVDISDLSTSQKEVINILKEVGNLIHEMWLRQYDEEENRCICYPRDATAKEIRKAAKDNPDLLDPYTVIKRKENGEFEAINYVDVCTEKFDKLCSLLRQAADKAVDPSLAQYLNNLADCYEEGDFEQALIYFITKPTTKIDVLMGPISSYPDKVLGVKKTFQFNLRVLLDNENSEIQEIIKVVKKLKIIKPIYSTIHKLSKQEVDVSIYYVLMFAGRQATSHPSATNLPDANHLVEKYGTKIIFYKNSMLEKTDKLLNNYRDLISGVSKNNKDYYTAYTKIIAYHEIAEAVIKYPETMERLKKHFDYMRELHAFMTGMRSASIHVLTGFISTDLYNKMIQIMILYGINAIKKRNEDTSILEYAKGFAIILNFALKHGVIEIKNNKMHFIFDRFHKLNALTNKILEIMTEGDNHDAQNLLDEYCDYSPIEKLLDTKS